MNGVAVETSKRTFAWGRLAAHNLAAVQAAAKPTLRVEKPVARTLGEIVADAGLKQLRIAETEKYAHVTFFFNGGEERQYPGEERILVPSPKVATYDLQPEMSAFEVADKLVAAIESGTFDFILVNFANGDMVGHTGVLPAAIQAIEAVKLICGIGEPLIGRLVAFDALAMKFREFKLRKDPKCPVCSANPTITDLIDYDQFCGIPQAKAAEEAEAPVPTINVKDLKTKLEDRLPAFDQIVFHEKLGTQAERIARIEPLAVELAPLVKADPKKVERAARLAKADLLTDVVGEFPETQGLMGKYYALAEGMDAEIAAACEDHYKPQGPADRVPNAPVSVAVAGFLLLFTLSVVWLDLVKPISLAP